LTELSHQKGGERRAAPGRLWRGRTFQDAQWTEYVIALSTKLLALCTHTLVELVPDPVPLGLQALGCGAAGRWEWDKGAGQQAQPPF